MKESLAILFVGLLTGMVFAQSTTNQFRTTQNSGSRSGSGTVGHSNSNPNTSGAAHTTSDGIQIRSRPTAATPSRGQNKVHVPINTEIRDQLLREGQIDWHIKSNSSVHQVTIGQGSTPRFGQQPIKISSQSRSADGKELRFELSEEQIRSLSNSYLHYDVRDAYSDKVKKIVIRTAAKPQNPIAPHHASTQHPISNQGHGPQRGGFQPHTNPQLAPPRFTQPPVSTASHTNPRWNLPLDNAGRHPGGTIPQQPVQTEQDILAEQRRRRNWEEDQRLARLEQDLAVKRLQMQQQADLLNAQQRATQPQPQPYPPRYAANPIAPVAQPQPMLIPQHTGLAAWQPPPVIDPEKEHLKRLNAEAKLQNQKLESRMASMENRIASNEELRRRFHNSAGPPETDFYTEPTPFDGRRPSLNASSANDSTRNKLVQQVQRDTQSETERPQNQNATPGYLMTVMLLGISGGINIYLWFIARSFHSRYNELADELRETFTATT